MAEINPGTAPFAAVVFSNDAGTKLEVVAPSNPLPVNATFSPSGTQDVNITKVAGATVATGHGTAAGALRVELPTDGTGQVTTVPQKSTTLTPSQVTVPATANGILVLAANANRLGATISNPSAVTVYISAAATGLTTTNGFGIPPGSSYNIDIPLYTGAIYGIVAAATQVVTVVELT